MKNFTDEKLVQIYLKGDEKALEELVRRYLPLIYSFSRRYSGNADNITDIAQEVFIKMWHQNAMRRGFWIPFGKEIRAIYEAFENNAYLLLAYQSPTSNSQLPISGALILIHDRIAYYFHAASTQQGRKVSAPYLVIWEAMKIAKEKNCQIFDFEGIYDKRLPIKSWQGFTHFKKSFGGKELEFPAPITKIYSLILKFLIRFL